MGDVRTVKIKFSDLVFLEDNPRTIKKEHLSRLAERIKEDPTFFDNRPALVNFTDGRYVCYAGFQRSHAAAKILKWKEVPCSVENDVPTEQMRKRAILDNTHDGDWDADILANWEFDVEELGDMGVPGWVFGGDGGAVSADGFGEEFDLPSGDKAPFQQMTFTLADEQAEQIKSAISDIKQTEEYKYVETLGNENTNGNALYLIIMQWAERRK
jgi:hypothetical protein